MSWALWGSLLKTWSSRAWLYLKVVVGFGSIYLCWFSMLVEYKNYEIVEASFMILEGLGDQALWSEGTLWSIKSKSKSIVEIPGCWRIQECGTLRKAEVGEHICPENINTLKFRHPSHSELISLLLVLNTKLQNLLFVVLGFILTLSSPLQWGFPLAIVY